MRANQGDKPTWRQRLKDKYRLVIMHDKTFEVETSVKLSGINLLVIFSTLLVVIAVLVYATIALTPLKNYVSGYSEVQTTRQLMENSSRVDSILRELQARDTFIAILQGTLRGELDTAVSRPGNNRINYTGINIDTVSDMDVALRRQIEQEDVFNLTAVDPRKTGKENIKSLHFFTPVKGTVTSGFNPTEGHYGIDVVAREDTPIKACLDGIVIDDYWSLEHGNVIVIQHDYGLISLYKHNSQLLKKRGSFVRAGDVIAIIGNSGEMSSGPHLHFELWHNKVAVDPGSLMIFN